MLQREVILACDCHAVRIPSGEEIVLAAGSPVVIARKAGGYWTVATRVGRVRVAGRDGDAPGLGVADGESEPEVATERDAEVKEDDIWARLRRVHDPEIAGRDVRGASNTRGDERGMARYRAALWMPTSLFQCRPRRRGPKLPPRT